MAWGIADTASQIERIRAESSDYLGGLNSVGEIDYTTYSELWDFYHDLLGKAYEQGLKDAPNNKSKDAEPVKHGHWIGKPIAGYSTVRCSECGDVFMENTGKWNYCPNCGAKMGAEDDKG